MNLYYKSSWIVSSLLVFYALGLACGCSGTSSNSQIATSSPPGATSPGGGVGVTSPAPTALDSEEAAFVTLINAWRTQNGLQSLQVSATLTASSKWMSQDMANHDYLSHTDSLGRDPGTRMFAFGYPSDVMTWGENIAAGNSDAQNTFSQWQNSPPHNANMLDSSYLAMGVGRAYNASSTYGWYWTTDFGSTVDQVLQ